MAKKKTHRMLFGTTGLATVFMMTVILILTVMMILSFVLPKKTVSERENRTLAAFPKFSVASYFSGEFNTKFDEHYSDTFPFRDYFLNINDVITRYTSQFTKGGEDDIVVINTGERDLGGEGFGDYENYEETQNGENDTEGGN